jgi:uncharacterized membrane protein YidH (DUF202 family)
VSQLVLEKHEQKGSARERDQLTLQRSLLACERTLNAWIRTGLGVFVAGLGIANFLSMPGKQWIARLSGLILVLLSGGIFLIAAWRYHGSMCRMKEAGAGMVPFRFVDALVKILLVVTLLGIFLVL